MPSVVNMDQPCDEIVHSFACPYIQSIPYIMDAALGLKRRGIKVLQPIVHMEMGGGPKLNAPTAKWRWNWVARAPKSTTLSRSPLRHRENSRTPARNAGARYSKACPTTLSRW